MYAGLEYQSNRRESSKKGDISYLRDLAAVAKATAMLFLWMSKPTKSVVE